MTSKCNQKPASGDSSESSWEKLGITPLMRAARSGGLDACRQLLESGAKVDAADNAGWTALMGAAAEGHEGIVQLLMDHGADVDAPSYDNARVVHAAPPTDMPA